MARFLWSHFSLLKDERPHRRAICGLGKGAMVKVSRARIVIQGAVQGVGFRPFVYRFATELALVLPDIATCSDCLREIFDPSDRRYLYPFTNCTNCGPRFSILKSLPYDRTNTTMKIFEMCEACRAEYDNPLREGTSASWR